MDAGRSYTFRKNERLSRVSFIELLFRPSPENQVFHSYPLRVVWRRAPLETKQPAQVVIAVSKKYSKKSVSRQLIKRRIREAYRLHKHSLYDCLAQRHFPAIIAVSYIGKEEQPYASIEKAWQRCIAQICKTVSKLDS